MAVSVLKRSKNGSQTWERAADGNWRSSEQVDPRSIPKPGMLIQRESHEELRKRNRLHDPRVVARMQQAVRKVMTVSAFRDTLKQEVGDEHAAAIEAMLDPAVSPPKCPSGPPPPAPCPTRRPAPRAGFSEVSSEPALARLGIAGQCPRQLDLLRDLSTALALATRDDARAAEGGLAHAAEHAAAPGA